MVHTKTVSLGKPPSGLWELWESRRDFQGLWAARARGRRCAVHSPAASTARGTGGRGRDPAGSGGLCGVGAASRVGLMPAAGSGAGLTSRVGRPPGRRRISCIGHFAPTGPLRGASRLHRDLATRAGLRGGRRSPHGGAEDPESSSRLVSPSRRWWSVSSRASLYVSPRRTVSKSRRESNRAP